LGFRQAIFQINYRGDDLGRASVKALGKLLDSSLLVTVDAIRHGMVFDQVFEQQSNVFER
jgi:hypothetical protein